MGVSSCTWVKLLTDLQIWSCELHKNAIAPPDLIAIIRGRGGTGRRRGKREGRLDWIFSRGPQVPS